METVVCNFCGRDDTRLVYRACDTNYGIPGQFRLVQCRHCRLVYLNPRPAEAECSSIYPEARYDPFRAVNQAGALSPHPIQWERARQLTASISQGRVLDVGCADGLFLQAMRQSGWQCVGVEPAPHVAEFARRQGQLDVRPADIFGVRDFESFDLITLWDTLEHTPSPRNVLSHAHRLLVARGMLALSLPNWDSLERQVFRAQWIAIDAPRHFYHFAPATIRQLLQACDFHVESLQTRASNMSLASNILRLGGKMIRRRGVAHQVLPSPREPAPSQKHQMAIRAVHLGVAPFSPLINFFHWGTDLLILARKVV